MRILLVEDDELTQAAIASSLNNQNYIVDVAGDGVAGWDFIKVFSYDLILLDVMLPKLDGISLCRRLRSENYTMPVLLLTARDKSLDKVVGLDAGADDYVVKPIDTEELRARIRTLLRRSNGIATPILRWGDLQLNPSTYEVKFAEQVVQVTKTEFGLLELFMRGPRQVFSRGDIIEHLWSFDNPPSEDTIKSHMKSLRSKLKAAGTTIDCFETIYGKGYRLNPSMQDIPTVSSNRQKQKAQDEISNLWERFKANNFERLIALEKAAIAISKNEIDVAMHQQAIETAHKLVGSLGMFGMNEGSRIAREIEHLLLDNPLSKLSQFPIASLVKEIRSRMEAKLSDSSQKQTQAPPINSEVLEKASQILQLNHTSLPKVLYVDDDPTMLEQIHHLLKSAGIEAFNLQDPALFWDTLELTAPDLLILDVNMPNFNGIDLCQFVRNDPRWNWLPILVLTAHTDRATVLRIFSAGADDYLPKPLDTTELTVRIANRLERTRLLRSLPRLV